MAYRKKFFKKGSGTGKLMLSLKNRDKFWIPCSPEDGLALRGQLWDLIALGDQRAKAYDFTPRLPLIVRIDEITAIQYFPPKAKPKAEEEDEG